MLSRSRCFISCRLLIMALAMAFAAGCAVDDDEPFTDEASIDEGSDEAELATAGGEAELGEPALAADAPDELALASECTNDAGCPQGYMCVKPVFKANYCAQLCTWDAIGQHNCPPGFDCTRPFFGNRWRCTPD